MGTPDRDRLNPGSMKLCTDCETASGAGRRPAAHRQSGNRGEGVWDTRREALCAGCWALWRMEGNETVLVRVLTRKQRAVMLARLAYLYCVALDSLRHPCDLRR